MAGREDDPLKAAAGFDPIAADGMEEAADRGQRFLAQHFRRIKELRIGCGGEEEGGRRRDDDGNDNEGGEGGGGGEDDGNDDDDDDPAASPREWMRFCQGYQGRFVDDVAVELPPMLGRPLEPDAVVVRQSPATGQQRGQGGGKGGGSKGGGSKGGGTKASADADADRGKDPALTATTVWDGAVVLAQYFLAAAAEKGGGGGAWRPPDELLPPPPPDERGEADAPAPRLWPRSRRRAPVIVELGAGTGLAGLVAAAAGGAASAVCLTDVPGVARPGDGPLAANARLNAETIASRGRAWRRRCFRERRREEEEEQGQEQEEEELEVVVRPLRWGAGPEARQDLEGLPAPFGLAAAAAAEGPRRRRKQQRKRSAGPDVVAGADLVYYSYSPETPHSRLLLHTTRRLLEGGEPLDDDEDDDDGDGGGLSEEEGGEAAEAATPAAVRGPASGADPPIPQALAVLALSLQHNPREVARFLHWAEADYGLRVRIVDPARLPEEYRTAEVLVAELWLRR